MKPKKKVEKAIRSKLRFTAGSTLRDRLLTDVMNARDELEGIRPALHEPALRRRIMRNPITKLAAAAAVLVVAVTAVSLMPRLTSPAYALGQTVDALKSIQFLHLVTHDDAGRIVDERWIEIGRNGLQVRYRQQHPRSLLLKYRQNGEITLAPGDDLTMVPMAVEDGQSTALYRYDRQAVILYDRKDQQYQWVGDLGGTFENLADKGKILEENMNYQGRPAHKVWWPALSSECYVDPDTKLPIAIGKTQLSYEQPPAETFEIVIPEGYAVLDKRPGAVATDVPDWLRQEDETLVNSKECFSRGTKALARGDYAEAVEQLKQGIDVDSWAPFWLGNAYSGLGQYDLAIESYTRHLDLFQKYAGGKTLPYCQYARGLAYARLGMLDEATADFQAALPAMIQTLRIPSGGQMFEYADCPLMQSGQYRPGEYELLAKMINRLRIISGQDFGCDPALPGEQNEAAIAAWEQWLKDGAAIRFTPDATLLEVPSEWIVRLGYGHKSNQEIAARYTPQWLNRIDDPGTLLKVGLALYDAKCYDQAMELFRKIELEAGDSQRLQTMALIWQGHVLDLLGRRDAAIAKYRIVAEMGVDDFEQRFAQFGLAYTPSPYAKERMTTPFVRVENKNID